MSRIRYAAGRGGPSSAGADDGPGFLGEGAGAAAALRGPGVVGGAVAHAPHDSLGDGGQPEEREGDVEVPVGDAGAARAPAVGSDVLLLGRDPGRDGVPVLEAVEP